MQDSCARVKLQQQEHDLGGHDLAGMQNTAAISFATYLVFITPRWGFELGRLKRLPMIAHILSVLECGFYKIMMRSQSTLQMLNCVNHPSRGIMSPNDLYWLGHANSVKLSTVLLDV